MTEIETKNCGCGGTMYHSSNMENPHDGDVPFWQCEDCGAIITAATAAGVRPMKDYQFAYVNGGTGGFIPVEQFSAENDDEANRWAEANAARLAHEHNQGIDDWYVLDADGDNINA